MSPLMWSDALSSLGKENTWKKTRRNLLVKCHGVRAKAGADWTKFETRLCFVIAPWAYISLVVRRDWSRGQAAEILQFSGLNAVTPKFLRIGARKGAPKRAEKSSHFFIPPDKAYFVSLLPPDEPSLLPQPCADETCQALEQQGARVQGSPNGGGRRRPGVFAPSPWWEEEAFFSPSVPLPTAGWICLLVGRGRGHQEPEWRSQEKERLGSAALGLGDYVTEGEGR
ncbi:unnamed protein product [Rangifer tarandus platyrhynchus]|uniref:Uncharacterized protein n=1 Tax=Rangifer tarandus platyrhynchus TaxID=3082113 RepID=A0AC59ZS56_RANTA